MAALCSGTQWDHCSTELFVTSQITGSHCVALQRVANIVNRDTLILIPNESIVNEFEG